jgi:hypothetical protein
MSRYHAEQLGAIGRLQCMRSETKLEGIEWIRLEESTRLCVGMVRLFRILIEIILRIPVSQGNRTDRIAPFLDVIPVLFKIRCIRKKATNACSVDVCSLVTA